MPDLILKSNSNRLQTHKPHMHPAMIVSRPKNLRSWSLRLASQHYRAAYVPIPEYFRFFLQSRCLRINGYLSACSLAITN